MFGRGKKREELQAGMINTMGRDDRDLRAPVQPQEQPQPAPQYIPQPPPIMTKPQPVPQPAPQTPPELQTFVNEYRMFGPESFTAPGVYEATVCNLLWGIYAEIHKANRE
jgi:hypothetical protein